MATIFKMALPNVSSYKTISILILISLTVASGPIDNQSAMIQLMALCLTDDKPLL